MYYVLERIAYKVARVASLIALTKQTQGNI